MKAIYVRIGLICFVLGAIFSPIISHAQWVNDGPILDERFNHQRGPTSASNGKGGVFVAWGGSSYNYSHVQLVDKWGLTCWGPNARDILPCDGTYPEIVASDDGGVIIGQYWNNGISTCFIKTQKLDIRGHTLWNEPTYVCFAEEVNSNAQMATDGSSGVILTWGDKRNGSNDYNIYAQRVDSSGIVQWDTNGVAICTTAVDAWSFPRIVSDGSGGAIITWGTHVSDTVQSFAQRISGDGTTQWTTNGFPIYPAQNAVNPCHSAPQIVSDGAGGAIIVWYDFRDYVPGDEHTHIYAQRISHSGVTQWATNGELLLPDIFIWPSFNETDVISDGAGGAIIVYGYYDIHAQKINSGGSVQWTADGVSVCTASGSQRAPQLASDMSGGAIIAWTDNRPTLGRDIYTQRISTAGTTEWTSDGVPFDTSRTYSGYLNINSDGEGGAIITWEAEELYFRECKINCVTGYGVYSIKGAKLWPNQIPPTNYSMNC